MKQIKGRSLDIVFFEDFEIYSGLTMSDGHPLAAIPSNELNTFIFVESKVQGHLKEWWEAVDKEDRHQQLSASTTDKIRDFRKSRFITQVYVNNTIWD